MQVHLEVQAFDILCTERDHVYCLVHNVYNIDVDTVRT